jgi:hypothetical protein
MNILQPCPCCGYAAPEFSDTSERRYLEVSIGIFDLVLCPANKGGCGMTSGWYDTQEEAAVAWNRRV